MDGLDPVAAGVIFVGTDTAVGVGGAVADGVNDQKWARYRPAVFCPA